MKKQKQPYLIQSISEQHRYLGLPKPKHPMISVFKFEEMKNQALASLEHFVLGFYCISIKKTLKEN